VLLLFFKLVSTIHLLLSLVSTIHFMYNAKIWNSQVLIGDKAQPLILPPHNLHIQKKSKFFKVYQNLVTSPFFVFFT
jgi:hypothetical protein